MVADQLDYVVGVDPHRDQHAVGVVETVSGVVVFETVVAADSGGYADALAVAETYAPGMILSAGHGIQGRATVGLLDVDAARQVAETMHALATGSRARLPARGTPLGR